MKYPNPCSIYSRGTIHLDHSASSPYEFKFSMPEHKGDADNSVGE